MAFAGLAAIMGGSGVSASAAKLPGILMALAGSLGFALGTVLAKKLPVPLPPIPAAAWQIGLGRFPVVIVGLARDHASGGRQPARLVAADLFHRDPVLHRLCELVCRVIAPAGLGRRDRHHGGACDRRGGLRYRTARAVGPDPDRGTGVYARRRRASDAVVTS
jgi:hypothetical protein